MGRRPGSKNLTLVEREAKRLNPPPPPPPLDYPHADIPLLQSNGEPSEITIPIQYLPWADTLPRTDLADALTEDDGPKALEFLRALSDPLKQDLPLSILAAQAGIRVPELMSIWRAHMKVAAMGVALSQAPLIAQHTVEDAKSITVCCGRCDGAGTMRVLREEGLAWITCKTCKGSGEVQRPGDPKSREWVLRAADVIAAEKTGVTVNLQNNFGADSVLDELDRIERNTVEVVAIPDRDA